MALVQAGLKPKFVDVDIDSFNINYENLKKISQKNKGFNGGSCFGQFIKNRFNFKIM